MPQTAKSETQGTPPRVRVRYHSDTLVPAAQHTLTESSRSKVLAMLVEPERKLLLLPVRVRSL